ncbi:cinnamoyl-CoA reductase CAD2-like [Humulus lupulus]|uniref:cinnamoyl-CoA reductase CAD2-like n=1 Tax=Humulus lupulus TaxID=3486 RepID=UPI002B411EE2|nr:cinnamoyl-CoA reductase CAD2-like [Humulus lupulus]
MEWSEFLTLFNSKYFGKAVIKHIVNDFTNLKQGTSSVQNYARKFDQLSRFVKNQMVVDIRRMVVVVVDGCDGDAGGGGQMQLLHILSKTIAEAATWDFAKENKMNLVTINPSYVIGLISSPTLSSSVEMILNQMNGKSSRVGFDGARLHDFVKM